jgi:hypothetical protein
LRHGVARLQLGPLGVEQGQKVGDALSIPRARDIRSAHALARLIHQLDEPLLFLAISCQRALGFFQGAQDDELELREHLARGRLGPSDTRACGGKVEPGPAERRRHRPCARVGAAKQASAPGNKPEKSRNRDPRIELRDRHSFERCGARQPALRRTHIRTAAQELVRRAD